MYNDHFFTQQRSLLLFLTDTQYSIVWLFHSSFSHIPTGGHSGFQLLTITKNTLAKLIGNTCQVFFFNNRYLEVGLLGDKISAILNFNRNWQIVLQSRLFNLHSHQQSLRSHIFSSNSLMLPSVSLY